MKKDSLVYFDNAATTKPFLDKISGDVINFLFEKTGRTYNLDTFDFFANPSSSHKLGVYSNEAIDAVRELIATKFKTSKDNVVFTSGATESNNLAIIGALIRKGIIGEIVFTSDSFKYFDDDFYEGSRGNIIVSSVEHPSVLKIEKFLSKFGVKVKKIKVDKNGIIDLSHLKSLLDDDTILVSVQSVNNEIGTIQPIQEAFEIVTNFRENILFHCDHVQGFLKEKLDLSELPIDLVSVSAHKIGGFMGTGALVLRNRNLITPVFYGGGQEFSLRPGTQNLQGIVSFGYAVVKFEEIVKSSHFDKLKKYFLEKLKKYPLFTINGSVEKTVSNIVSLNVNKGTGELIRNFLENEGIIVSTQSACHSSAGGVSHVLKAIGVKEREATIRISFGWFNDFSDIDRFFEKLEKVLHFF